MPVWGPGLFPRPQEHPRSRPHSRAPHQHTVLSARDGVTRDRAQRAALGTYSGRHTRGGSRAPEPPRALKAAEQLARPGTAPGWAAQGRGRGRARPTGPRAPHSAPPRRCSGGGQPGSPQRWALGPVAAGQPSRSTQGSGGEQCAPASGDDSAPARHCRCGGCPGHGPAPRGLARPREPGAWRPPGAHTARPLPRDCAGRADPAAAPRRGPPAPRAHRGTMGLEPVSSGPGGRDARTAHPPSPLQRRHSLPAHTLQRGLTAPPSRDERANGGPYPTRGEEAPRSRPAVRAQANGLPFRLVTRGPLCGADQWERGAAAFESAGGGRGRQRVDGALR